MVIGSSASLLPPPMWFARSSLEVETHKSADKWLHCHFASDCLAYDMSIRNLKKLKKDGDNFEMTFYEEQPVPGAYQLTISMLSTLTSSGMRFSI